MMDDLDKQWMMVLGLLVVAILAIIGIVAIIGYVL